MIPRPRRRIFLALWLFGISGIVASLTWSFWPLFQRQGPRGPIDSGSTGRQKPSLLEMELADEVPGKRTPPAHPAAGAALADDQLVVGVTAGGRSRAYALKAMSFDASCHVVNDVLGGEPVSVTYCDRYRCTRVFTGGTSGEPLDLGVGGLKRGGLILRTGGHSYLQDSGEPLKPDEPAFPYLPHEGVVQTWGEWRHAHPDTDVYLGKEEPEPARPSPPASPPAGPEPKPEPPDSLSLWLAPAVYVGAVPLGIGCVTLLLHVLLAYVLGPRRPR